MPSQTFTHTAIAPAPAEDVWAALDRPETWQSIGGVDRVFDPVIDPTGRLCGFSFETVAGGRKYLGTAVPEQREEGRVIAWRVHSTEVTGTTRVELASDDAGTSLTVTLEVASAGPLSSLLFPVIAGAVGRGFPGAVEAFAAGFRPS